MAKVIKSIKYLGIAAVLILLLAFVIREANKFFLTLRPPLTYIAPATTDTPVVRAGEKLNIIYVVNRDRHCEAKIHKFIIRLDTNAIVGREEVIGGMAEIGKSRIPAKMTVPADVEPGQYKFITRHFSHCYEGQHMATHPPVFFEVIQ